MHEDESQTSHVTVIICVYNAAGHLLPCVESVLAQTYENLDVIVVDDGSTDGAVDSIRGVEDPRLRILTQENLGKSVALNRAIAASDGEFFAIQDADDLSHPRRIERLVAAMQENPQVAAVFSGHELILNGRRMAPRARAKGPDECRRDIEAMRMPAHDPTGMYRMTLVRGFRYDESVPPPFVEGYDYILRVGERWPMMVVGECLYSYRVHAGSITRVDATSRDRLVLEVLRCACERRGIDYDRWRAAKASKRRKRLEGFEYGLAAHFMESAVDQRREGRFMAAVRTGLACSRLRPWSPRFHKALVYALGPPELVRRLRGRR